MPTATLEKNKTRTATDRAIPNAARRAKPAKLNKATLDAIRDVDGDGGKVYKDAEELYKDLGI